MTMMTGAEYPSVGRPCPDPLAPPPESPTLPSEGSIQARNYSGNGPPPCAGCSQPILDQFILQVQGHTWHSRCLQCAACRVTLTQTCYSGQNQLYCQEDFFRLFGSHCSACKLNIPPTEVVRRAHDNVYHLNCFRCSVCARELCTGDEFYMGTEGHLLCQTDFVNAKGKEQDENEKPDRSSPMQTSDADTPNNQRNERVLSTYFFSTNSNPKRPEMEGLARRLEMDLVDVRTWFKQRRAKTRRKDDNSNNGIRRNIHNRVTSPPGGYPLPIVNKARSPGRLPTSARQPLQVAPPILPLGHAPFHQTQLTASNFQAWEELWSNDFVPPNVDLDPNHLKNGEVIQMANSGSAPITGQPITTPSGIGFSSNASCPLPPIQQAPLSNPHPLPNNNNNNNNNDNNCTQNQHFLHHHHQQQQQHQNPHPCNMSNSNEHGIGTLPWVS